MENLSEHFWKQLQTNLQQQIGIASPFGIIGKIFMIPFVVVTIMVHIILIAIFYR